eukprot:TRINITY_DN2044_c0_g2_i1.p2 TRINITY_DN2044_c0_g2~~TRINITY_DN2044_c0_g2_i1.p2  ORF type:complete len:262 (+),score=38.62 TRINITY_DN2044_c0_g2_i1:630-1415(+)
MKPFNQSDSTSSSSSSSQVRVQLVLDLQDGIGRISEPLCFLLREVHVGDGQDPPAAELSWEAEEDLSGVHPIESLGEDGDGVDAALVPEEGSGEAGDGVADGPGGVALEADDLVGAPNHGPVDPLKGLLLVGDLLLLQKAQHRNPSHAYARPESHRAVPMFSNDVCLYVLCVHIQMVRDEESEAGRVEIRARADDPVGGESGELPGHVGQDIDWVRHDQQDGIRRVAGEAGDDVGEEGDVPLDEVQAGLPGDLAGAGSDDA